MGFAMSPFRRGIRFGIFAGVCAILVVFAAPARADDAAQMARLWAALRMEDSLSIMHREGREHALNSAKELTGQAANDGWRGIVERIYDPEPLRTLVYKAMQEALVGRDMSEMIAYYESAEGARVITLEISAREAYLSPGVEEAAREAWNWGAKDGTRADLIRKFVNDGDLVERNVAGALNSNVAFLTAFSEATPKEFEVLDERAILAEVMGEEAQIRVDTTEWLFGYLSLAYAPLSDAELQRLVDLSASPAGRALNVALFDGFHPMYQEIARGLGQAAGQAQSQQEL